jgi:hypothetical protein
MEQGAKSKTRDQKTDDNIPIANAQCNRLSQISFLIADRLIENPACPVDLLRMQNYSTGFNPV